MAGLVDYNSDSCDREDSEEETKGRTKHNEAGEKSSWKPKPTAAACTSSDKETSSSSRHSKHSKSPKTDGEVKHSKKDKDHKHKKRSRSRSRSRDRHRKSRDFEKKSSSHHRREEKKKKKHKSRSRSRSRGRSRSRSRSRDRQPRRTRSQERREKKAETIARMGLDVTSVAAGFVSTGSNQSEGVDKQQAILAAKAAAQVLQNRVQQVQQATGVQLPAFYNPAAVNPVKYAEQIQKRKLLWSSNKDKQQQPAAAAVPATAPTAAPGPSSSTVAKLWQSTAFEQDQDGKVTAKFKRLMGIKDPPPEQQQQQDTAAAASAAEPETPEVLKRQKQLFQALDQQYQKAREVTHTQRGLGLGFSSSHPR